MNLFKDLFLMKIKCTIVNFLLANERLAKTICTLKLSTMNMFLQWCKNADRLKQYNLRENDVLKLSRVNTFYSDLCNATITHGDLSVNFLLPRKIISFFMGELFEVNNTVLNKITHLKSFEWLFVCCVVEGKWGFWLITTHFGPLL